MVKKAHVKPISSDLSKSELCPIIELLYDLTEEQLDQVETFISSLSEK